MHVAVCAKQVPGPGTVPRLDEDTATLLRDGEVVLDAASARAVEVALRLVDGRGGEVTVVSMTPGYDLGGVRTALAMGATRAVVVSDAAAAGSDALGTARVLAAAVRWAAAQWVSPVDIVVAGTESADGCTGTVPAQMAELLGLPSVTFVRHVEVLDGDGGLRAHRETEDGYDEVVCTLPALVSVAPNAVVPRCATFSGVIGTGSKPLERLSLAGVSVDAASVGTAGARQRITGVVDLAPRPGREIVVDDGNAHERLLAFFEEVGAV